MGRKKTDEYNEAYDLFCNTELTRKKIAGIVKVSEVQIGKWAKDNDWELDKTANQVTKEKLVRGFYQEMANIKKFANTEKRNLTPAETDQIIKLTNSIDTLGKKYNLSNYHSVLKECLEWMNKNDNETAKRFGPVMLEFLKYKATSLKND
ncbi:hypothetical protein [Pinibacter soli]|uniref:Terminase small subunit n=1 Tax=Pinibacter soli TaxID=3044211 RepID=A0ABT6R991_9BACT|nr:hypothetical protein [Pinibacter soli]MDI3319136.1 hypothetical protein [Pinibacter soli]